MTGVSGDGPGVKCAFDFYQPSARQLFKVFTRFDQKEYQQYATHRYHPVIIFDSICVSHHIEDRDGGYKWMKVTDATFAEATHADPRVAILHGGDLWQFRGQIDGEWIWRKIMPAVLREFVGKADKKAED